MRRSIAGLSVSILTLAVLSRGAAAQTACQGSVGPDVIVGEIHGPANYTHAEVDLEALSLGTTSCNMGTQPLNWIASTNQHPVIGGALYRYKVVEGAGRFEQVGLSWLKHGFFALSEGLCCANCVGDPTGAHLGVGCSDPYTADMNGDQSSLGPRYQVNPHTGSFTYPPTQPPSITNTGRLEVLVRDLEATSGGGARYFGECQYVTADDAAAANQNNNASYREVTVSGSTTNWDFGLTGSTQREQPAIRAWAVAESGVTQTNIQIANDGLLILGCKTTPLAGGKYHYEYALYNMNADRGVGSFSIPVPPGVLLSNVDFHDVKYRGGDGVGGMNQEATDWSSIESGGALTWATETFVQNPNANAIRWGTTYNFRFDANTAPTAGTITIGTFKDGGSLQTAGDVPGAPPAVSAFCAGDGSLPMGCPCSNTGSPDHGCANSQNAAGAILASSGTVNPDALVLSAAGELPSVLTIFLQGDGVDANGILFGDGVLCVDGSLRRLYAKNASGGAVSAPTGSEPSITARSAALGDPIAPGSPRYYQTYYRDANAAFCPAPTGGTFNSSNGLIVVW